jgi:hypothetical protein
MKRLETIMAAVLAVSLTGCKLSAKKTTLPPTPAPPVATAQPLSVPQTQVMLPRAQPFDPDALSTNQPPTEEPPTAPRTAPAGNSGSKPPARTSTRNATPTAPPATSAAAPPKPETPPAEPPRPQIQEILPPEVQQQLRKQAQDSAQQARQLLNQANKRRPGPQEREAILRINQLLTNADNAAKTGDVRTADDMAAKALSLAKDLQSGK